MNNDAHAIEVLMNEYLDVKAALLHLAGERCATFQERCYTAEWLAESRKRNQQDLRNKQKQSDVVLNVVVDRDAAKAFTAEGSNRYIYNLQRTDSIWRISSVGWKCSICDGTGVDDGLECAYCSGEGWSYGESPGHSITDEVTHEDDDWDLTDPHRFSIRELMIKDDKGRTVAELDIREFADMSSSQFKNSKLSVRQKSDIIVSVDEERLVEAIDRLCLWQAWDNKFEGNGEEAVRAFEMHRDDFYKILGETCEYLSSISSGSEIDQQTQPIRAPEYCGNVEAVSEFMRQYFEWRDKLMYTNSKSSDSSLVMYFTEDCWKTEHSANAQNHPDIVLDIDLDGEKASVVTSELIGVEPIRRIYHLHKANVGWQIERRGVECFSCKGAGSAYGKTCAKCHGLKWYYPWASDR